MAAVYPGITIDAPPVERYTGGLYAVAPPQPGPVVDGNARRWENGIQYEALTCADPSAWAPTCGTDPTRVDKEPSLEFPLVEGTPFVVYLGVQCALPGNTLQEYERRVRAALALCEQRTVERTYWTGDMGNESHLASGVEVTIVNPDPATPMGVVQGVAALESHLGDNYCGVGVLHAPRGLSPYAAENQLLRGNNPSLTTPLGTRWAFGAGYSVNTGPDGTPAPDGMAWIYATGQVNIWRSEIFLQPDRLEAAFNTRTNDVVMLAERVFVITHECTVAAALVRLDCDC